MEQAGLLTPGLSNRQIARCNAILTASHSVTRRSAISAPRQHFLCRKDLHRCRATEQAAEAKPPGLAESVPAPSGGDGWVEVLAEGDLPKGVRKEIRIGEQTILLLWYRNDLYALESRSPAEGAYSEGFIAAKLNQDYCIECPSTGSLFDLRSGEIKSWYPTNLVLRLLTPQSTSRPLAVFPVKTEGGQIKVDVSKARVAASTRGGAELASQKGDTASLEPKEFLQGSDLDKQPGSTEQGTAAGQLFTAITAIVGVLGAAVAGTAVAFYKESLVGLAIFWAVFIAGSGVYAYSIFNNERRS